MKIILLINVLLNVTLVIAIIGGKQALPNEYPWVLKLFVGRSQCGASLIREHSTAINSWAK